jgi:hypothetical protein
MATWKKIIVSGSDAHLKTGNFSSHVTASGNISGSNTSTGSFGRVIATTLAGDGAGITGLTSAAISSYTNSGNNRVVTSVDGNTVNSEENLEFDGTDLLVKGGGKVAFRDNGGEYIYSVSDNVLGLAAGSEIDLTATTIDLNGNLDVSGNVTSSYISSSNDIEAQGQILAQGNVIGANVSSSGNITGSDIFASSGLYGTLQTAAQTNITSVGALDAGSITSNFGTINNGASAITTTGLISGGSLDIDDVVIDNATIGHTDDTDLLTLADGKLTVAGETNTTTLIATSTISSSFISASNDIEAVGSVIGGAVSSSGNITGSDLFASSGIYGTIQTPSQTNITAVGTIATGVWQGTRIDTGYIDTTLTDQTSILNDSLKIGRADGNDSIDFSSDDSILFDIDNTERLKVDTEGIDVTGNITATGNATITGDLTVNGTTTTLSTTNLSVGDQFIFAATGSAGSNVDAGLIVQSGSAVDSGSALYHDINDERWAVAKGVKDTATSVTPLQHVVTVSGSVATNPNSTSGSYGIGEMWITDDEDIWVRTA